MIKHCIFKIRHERSPKIPIILIGLKTDLRNEAEETQNTFVTNEQGNQMAQEIGAFAYLECSAKENRVKIY